MRAATIAALAVLVLVAGCSRRERAPQPQPAPAEALPSKLGDEAFWRIVTDFSEPDGAFESDNFLSNERPFQRVIPDLEARLPKGGVYVGVGPEQNFTYLVALRPKLAFIIDIRRGNLLEQLFYKALFETSSDRAEFLSKLFARPRPDGLEAGAPVDALFAAYRAAAPSADLHGRTLQAVKDHLTKRHGFSLTEDDLRGLDRVSDAFYRAGPDLDYSFGSSEPGRGRIGGEPFPTYAELMTETDGRGAQRSYLASEESFRAMVDLELRNAVVPLVGDFGGPKTVRAVGRYVADHGATVTAFYTSNVELYLFRSDAWKRFYANVATLPVDSESAFIRFGSNRGLASEPEAPGPGASMRLCPIADLVRAVETGKVEGYYDVLALSR